MKRIALASALALLALSFGGVAHAQSTLKIATLAPEGSAWMVAFHEWAKNVEEHTGGKIKIKFFAGGTAGAERDAVRKMRLGQLNGAAVTAIGLGLINSEVRVLELPMLIDTYGELDYVRNKLDAELRKKFEDKGYVLLAWGDVGPVHIFSNTPIKGKADLAQLKLWAWVDDALVRALFTQLGVNGVPLGVPDVLPSLQTGLINACYGSPLSTLALQWVVPAFGETSADPTSVALTSLRRSLAAALAGPDFASERFMGLSITDYPALSNAASSAYFPFGL